jgi:hypothetical protein
MNIVPVANQGEGKQHKCNEQQAAGLRCVNGVMMVVPVGIVVFGVFQGRHANIVALSDDE